MEYGGSIPKVPNPAMPTNFGSNLVQTTQFAPRSVVAYFPYPQMGMLPLFVRTAEFGTFGMLPLC